MSSLTWITGQKIGREITLVQNEFTSDVTSFTTDVQTYLLQVFFSRGVKHATSLFNSFCSNVAKKNYTFYVARFTVPIDLLQLPLPLPSPFSITQFHFVIIILK